MWIGAINVQNVENLPVTLVETGPFVRDAERLLKAGQLAQLKMSIAGNPEHGDVIPGTGGVRKLRWALDGRGKRSGMRVVYFWHNHNMPIFLLAAYAKNERISLTKAERNTLKGMTQDLIAGYSRKSA